MRKASFARFGGPDVLTVVEAEEPRPDPGQVRIAVRAAAVNAHDWRLREGQFQAARAIDLPSGIGLEAAGVVDEVGDGVVGVSAVICAGPLRPPPHHSLSRQTEVL